MKTIFSFLFILFFSFNVSGQILKPVKWSYDVVELDGNKYEVHFKAKMDKKWAIYSQFTNDDGPIPTSFNFESNDKLSLENIVVEKGELMSGYDDLFETTVKKFKEEVDFVQTVELKTNETYLKGYITYMTCDDLRCLPPTDEEFSILIK